MKKPKQPRKKLRMLMKKPKQLLKTQDAYEKAWEPMQLMKKHK